MHVNAVVPVLWKLRVRCRVRNAKLVLDFNPYGIDGLYARHSLVYSFFLHWPFRIDSLSRAVLVGKLVD